MARDYGKMVFELCVLSLVYIRVYGDGPKANKEPFGELSCQKVNRIHYDGSYLVAYRCMAWQGKCYNLLGIFELLIPYGL